MSQDEYDLSTLQARYARRRSQDSPAAVTNAQRPGEIGHSAISPITLRAAPSSATPHARPELSALHLLIGSLSVLAALMTGALLALLFHQGMEIDWAPPAYNDSIVSSSHPIPALTLPIVRRPLERSLTSEQTLTPFAPLIHCNVHSDRPEETLRACLELIAPQRDTARTPSNPS